MRGDEDEASSASHLTSGEGCEKVGTPCFPAMATASGYIPAETLNSMQ